MSDLHIRYVYAERQPGDGVLVRFTRTRLIGAASVADRSVERIVQRLVRAGRRAFWCNAPAPVSPIADTVVSGS